ncbi:peptidase inhibitor family I36 protein [Actinomadura pelletieri]|nr:peptidase inhibitor family I36 protein [Actinomadura pelletieri]
MALVAMVPLGVVGLSAPASAGEWCGWNEICMFEDALYRGDRYVSHTAVPGRYQIDWWNGDNEISSAMNNSFDFCVRLYDNDDWSGATYTIGYDEVHSTLPGFNDRAESYIVWRCR